LILVILAFAYVRIQEDSSMVDASYLNPICFLFKNSNVSNPEGTFYCASASYTKNFYEQQLNNLEKEQSRKILSNLLNIYEKENFLKSKDVLFLLDKSKNRLQVVEVLNKFDALLKEFILPNKNKIQCRNVNIDSVNKTFEITCDAYSNSYESNSIV
jgi:hypothetical protein